MDMISIAVQFSTIRKASLQLCSTLTNEDCSAQSMPDASPIKWHLAHTTWFFETFILEKFEENFKAFNPNYRFLFNSYYNGIGDQFSRHQRGLLTRPSLQEVYDYRINIDSRILKLMDSFLTPDLLKLIEIGLHHEQQHQELMLTDIKHLFFQNPLYPAVTSQPSIKQPDNGEKEWISFDGGLTEVGHDKNGFGFDNERPRHRYYLQPYQMYSHLVTNAEYLNFIQDGGYLNPEFWLSEGWTWIRSQNIKHPLYWVETQEGWKEFSLNGLGKWHDSLPVLHVSFYEADAFARWAKSRLPTEFEWENAASISPKLDQIFQSAWQWTLSSYTPYPGFQTDKGALGEYNGKFMVNQYVLRGSSFATPESHERKTYRNFFPSSARWQFTGIRLAR